MVQSETGWHGLEDLICSWSLGEILVQVVA